MTNSTTDLSNIDANEVWKPIRGFETYQISNYGRIKFLFYTQQRIGYGSKDQHGYLTFKMSKRGSFYVHRLVAEAFIPNPENKPCVNHKDGKKQNNRVDNLKWVTKSENTQHAWDTGLIKSKQICQLDKNNKIIKIFLNMAKSGNRT